VPNILTLIPSFENKHIINVIVYIGFDVYAKFQRKERKECQWMYLEEDNIPILEAGRMKTKVSRVRVATGTNTMIPVPAPLTCGYQKYSYLWITGIHF